MLKIYNKLMAIGAKGISDLIATVLLIAVAIVVAMVVLNWSNFFSENRLDESRTDIGCMDAIDLSQPFFSNTTINVTISNTNNKISLVNLKARVTYENDVERVFENLTNASIMPREVANVLIDTGSTEKPKKIEVTASNCPEGLAFRNFR